MKFSEITIQDDPQQVQDSPCPICGWATYPPTFTCIRCERRKHDAGRTEPKL